MTRHTFPKLLPLTAIAIAASLNLSAQPSAPPSIRSVIHYTVKGDRAGDLSAAIKEYNEVLRKAHYGHSYTIWRSMTGPTEMLQVTYFQKWSELDTTRTNDPQLKDYQTELARIVARINESFSANTHVIDVVNQEVSLPRTPAPPKMLMVWIAHVKEGKMHDVVDLEKNEYLPAVKAAGIKSYSFAAGRFGVPVNELHASVGLENWGDFDQPNPVRKAMGDDKYRTFTDKMNALLNDFHYEVYRYDAALSYIAGQ